MNKANKLRTNTDVDDWSQFAAAAISGTTANPNSGANSPCDLAHYAASVADSMMKERNKRIDLEIKLK